MSTNGNTLPTIPIDIRVRIVDNITTVNGLKDLIEHAVNLAMTALTYSLNPTEEVMTAVHNVTYLLSCDVEPFEIRHMIETLRDITKDSNIGYLTMHMRKPIKRTDETLRGTPTSVMLLGICDILEKYHDFKNITN